MTAINLRKPYLLFLGNVHDRLAAKTAIGIQDWRPEDVTGQFRLPGCAVDLGIPDYTLEQGYAAGARTLILGVANRGGIIDPAWVAVLNDALRIGYDLANGLHQRLGDFPILVETAAAHGRMLWDVRYPQQTFPIATGTKRSGNRVLTVGTDCSIGKMYTSLAIAEELQRRGIPHDFRATGQTGILISGAGVSVDAVVSDFIAGAVEQLAPDNKPEHWDVLEGQGSLFHPSYAGVSLGLLHGSQPDVLVMCHEPTRTHMRGVDYPLPPLDDCIAANLQAARLTNPTVQLVGLSINTSALSTDAAQVYLQELQAQYNLPAVDPKRTGVASLVDAMLNH